uniref:Putative sugar activating enzyme n=1 Tax=Actinomadura melliaura TaxID=360723 RepID=Q0H2X0_9ACTN|nr:putative sugar activating enzyme [Actinomadura melliaura]
MKALVLAGGSGTRLRPLTHTLPKQLVPVANKPILFYGLEAIRQAGITQTGIVVGATGPEIRRAVGDGARFGLRVTYLEQDAPRGLAHAVSTARDYLGDDDFLMFLGDTFVSDGVTGIVDSFAAGRPAAEILLAKVSDPRAFGVAELGPGGAVVRLEEKPARPRSDLALAGVYAFTPAIHDAIAGLRPSGRGELEITDAIARLVRDGHRVTGSMLTGWWRDTGEVEDLLKVNELILRELEPRTLGRVDAVSTVSGIVVVEEGAVVRDSRIAGPAIVGAGSVVEGSSVGPGASIGPDCAVSGSEIAHSILLSGASVTGARGLAWSIIGRQARVAAVPAAPTRRVVLGDHSRTEI